MEKASMEEKEMISGKQALQIALDKGIEVTLPALYTWLDGINPRIHIQPGGVGGKIYVNKIAFIDFISGKIGA